MRIAVGVLTHNQFEHDRHELFLETLRSIKAGGEPFSLYIVDNGSTDGSAEYVESIGGLALRERVSTCGHGMNRTISICAKDSDLVVFSNDDIAWREGAFTELVRFWSHAPQDIVIASGLLEDDFPWNTPIERIEYGGVAGLKRHSAPGGAWTLRSEDWSRIGAVSEAVGVDDVPKCDELRAKGLAVCQLDLAEHLGEGRSTWGNASRSFGKPLDRKAWGL